MSINMYIKGIDLAVWVTLSAKFKATAFSPCRLNQIIMSLTSRGGGSARASRTVDFGSAIFNGCIFHAFVTEGFPDALVYLMVIYTDSDDSYVYLF